MGIFKPVITLAFAGIVSIIGLLGATSALAFEQEHSKIVIRTIGVAPYGIQRHANSSGIYFDFANLLAKKAGYKATNNIYPYARIINELKTGQTDMTIMFRYKKLNDHVINVAPLPSLKTVVVGLRGTSFTSIDQLKGKTIAHLRGANFSDAISKDSEILKVGTTNITQGIRMLMLKRVDAIIGPLTPIIDAAKQISKEGEEVVFDTPLIVGERTPWIQISKKSTDRISVEKLKAAFLEMEKQGTLKAIEETYVHSDKIN